VLVFLPGINIDGRIFLHLKDLSQYYELIVYEFSETSPLYQGELDDFVIILRDFLKELSLEQFNLVGTSFGGIISIRFYAQNKRDNINLNINKLILISTSIIGTTKKDIRRSIKTVKIMKKLPDYKLYFIIEKIAGRIKIPEETDIYPPLSEIITIRDINWYRQSTYASENYNAGPDAQEIDCPVLVLMGSEDELVDWKETKERAEEYIKQARIKIIDGASHLMVYLNAREVVQSIHQFIENTPLDEG
jgi:pimeloyl-ACP methyl ester carboxylesterase